MNPKIQQILACVDFSDYSLMVLAYAVELAPSPQTHILVYNVINQTDAYRAGSVSRYVPDKIDMEAYIKNLKKEREGMIKSLIKEHFFENKSQMHFKVDVDIPSQGILKTIKTDHIDLVVMANKGRGNLARFLFGSAAEKVFRHSPVPVVSVRAPSTFKRNE